MARSTSSVRIYCNKCGKIQDCKHIGYPLTDRVREYPRIDLTAYIRERECLECGFRFETAETWELMVRGLESEFKATLEGALDKMNEDFMKKSADTILLGWRQDLAFEIDGIKRCKERFLSIVDKIDSLRIKGELILEVDSLEKRLEKLEFLHAKIESAMKAYSFFRGESNIAKSM